MARLPPWFTVEQARKVAALRGVEHVLVEERGKITGSVSRYTLWRAPRLDTLARHLQPCTRAVSPEMPITEVHAEMQALGIECLPVASGGILVGTITLADIDSNLEVGSAAA
jgi:CBS domain-containing protein